MNSIVRPRRTVLFSERPKGQVQADLLDAQLHNLIEAINSTQTALADIRRDDGKLRTGSVGNDQLAVEIKHTRAEMDTIEARVVEIASKVTAAAGQVAQIAREIHLRALDAEKAAASTLGAVSQTNHNLKSTFDDASDAENSADRSEAAAIQSENWSNYSLANADNAIAAKNEATQWAEYLAGPVVNPNDAPAYIQNHPFGHGLYYQPVEGYGGSAGLWSAKWWAIYAAQLVGPWSFYYLGGWADPPIPGSVNPDTGIKIPNPLPPGSFYYDTDTDTVYFWNGSEWVSPYVLAAGVTSRFVYKAAAGQTVFSGSDLNSAVPAVGQSPSDVHLNGVKLVPTLDYTVDTATSTLTLLIPATVDSYVQWDLLVPPDGLTPSGVHSFKCTVTGAIDGVNKAFTLQYSHPTNGLQPTAVTNNAQLQVSLDGIVQEPGLDYAASAAALTFVTPPLQGARLWVVWFSTAVVLS